MREVLIARRPTRIVGRERGTERKVLTGVLGAAGLQVELELIEGYLLFQNA